MYPVFTTGSIPVVRRPRPSRTAILIARARELVSFGAVGAIAFVVDVGSYNLLRATVLPDGVIWAKVVSVALATIVAWLGNRFVTFRDRRGRPVAAEGLLFAVSNLVGLGIAVGCLWVSHYVLGFTSPLADNIAGNGVGLVLGTAFRYLAYRYLVFAPPRRRRRTHQRSARHRAHARDAGTTT